MDVSFKTDDGRFNLRVAAIILNGGKVLAMSDERSPYYYRPGGKIAFGETAETAVLRELREELGIEAKVVRPLYIAQSFFNEEGSKEHFHEICFYFLVDASETDLLSRGEGFRLQERHHSLQFEWLEIARLEKTYFYPLFLKTRLADLPASPQLVTELE